MQTIRQVEEQDIPLILEGLKTAHKESRWAEYTYSAERAEPIIRRCMEAELAFVSTKDNKITGWLLGFLAAHPCFDLIQAMEINFYVYPEHRNGALGKQLMNAYKNKAIELGANEILVDSSLLKTEEERDRVLVLYKRCGFTKYSEQYGVIV